MIKIHNPRKGPKSKRSASAGRMGKVFMFKTKKKMKSKQVTRLIIFPKPMFFIMFKPNKNHGIVMKIDTIPLTV